MKFRLPFFILLVTIGLVNCEKDEDNPPFYNAKCCIKEIEDNIYVDSLFQFYNCSDSINVTYLWNFGDGEISNERNPKHRYIKSGEFNVSLTTFVNKVATDSAKTKVNVFIGERYYKFSDYTFGRDFAEGIDSTIMLIGFTSDNLGTKYFISKFNKNLRLLWTKYPSEEENVGLISIELLNDGNFITGGSYSNTAQQSCFLLAKIDTSGNTIWSQSFLSGNGCCNFATQSLDGNIIAIGTEKYTNTSGLTLEKTVVIKVDPIGNLMWKKDFEGFIFSDNIIALNDGYLFAATKGSSLYYNNDSLAVTRINLDGSIIWQKIVKWSYPVNHIIPSTIAANSNCIIAQCAQYEEYIVFDFNGNVIKRGSTYNEGNSYIHVIKDNKFISIGSPISLSYIRLTCLNSSGDVIWWDVYGKLNSSYSQVNANGIKVKPTNDGNIVYLGLSFKDYSKSIYGVIVIAKINEFGIIQ